MQQHRSSTAAVAVREPRLANEFGNRRQMISAKNNNSAIANNHGAGDQSVLPLGVDEGASAQFPETANCWPPVVAASWPKLTEVSRSTNDSSTTAERTTSGWRRSGVEVEDVSIRIVSPFFGAGTKATNRSGLRRMKVNDCDVSIFWANGKLSATVLSTCALRDCCRIACTMTLPPSCSTLNWKGSRASAALRCKILDNALE